MLNSNPRMPKHNNHLINSFTLIELLVVIVMIAILLAMGLWVLISARQTRSLPTVADKVGGIFTLLKGFSSSPSHEMTDYCFPGESYISSGVIDQPRGYAYYGTDQKPAQIIKINLNTFEREAAITLNSGEDYLQSAVIDQPRGYAYFGTFSTPAKIIKIDIDPSRTFKAVSTLQLRPGENLISSGIIYNGFAYFAGGEGPPTNPPGYLAKIDLTPSNFAEWPTTVSLSGAIWSVVLDQNTHMAYIGGRHVYNGTTTYIHRVNLDTYTRLLPDLQLASGESDARYGLVYQGPGQPNKFLYFSSVLTGKHKIVKINPALWKEETGFVFPSNYGSSFANVVDQNSGIAYYATSDMITSYDKIIRIDLKASPPVEITPSITLDSFDRSYGPEGVPRVALLDQQNNLLYFTTYQTAHTYDYNPRWYDPSKIYKIKLDDFTINARTSLDQNNNSPYTLKELGMIITSKPIYSRTSIQITRLCTNDNVLRNVLTTSGMDTSFLGDISIPKNISFVDSNHNPAIYYVSIIVVDTDQSNIGKVTISTINLATGGIGEKNLNKMIMTDGSGIYYDIYIANNGSVSVKKE